MFPVALVPGAIRFDVRTKSVLLPMLPRALVASSTVVLQATVPVWVARW